MASLANEVFAGKERMETLMENLKQLKAFNYVVCTLNVFQKISPVIEKPFSLPADLFDPSKLGKHPLNFPPQSDNEQHSLSNVKESLGKRKPFDD